MGEDCRSSGAATKGLCSSQVRGIHRWLAKRPSFVGWAKRSVPTISHSRKSMVGTARARLCPPYDSFARRGVSGSNLQLMPCHAPVGFEIAVAGRINDAGRQRRWRGVAVPAAGFSLGVEIVAQRLLVEARLALAGLVDVDGPEPRTVGGHHLVDQNDAAILVAAELELGVGDDDALLAGGLFAKRVDRARHALQRGRDGIAQHFAHARDRDGLVMAGLGLGRPAENPRLELFALDEAGFELLAGERARRGIFLPARARDVAAEHEFDRKPRGAPA